MAEAVMCFFQHLVALSELSIAVFPSESSLDAEAEFVRLLVEGIEAFVNAFL
ncbi:MAG: hypothetical protein UY77_C0041G0008 [Candidatus Uhrbacteria bacterium GW2011_GWA2_53_10]|uniref:Uncharacterized protein n=1 Tax=Candidatus Uhrbacteria bacterium GW2011_GWA2_53_10 TaxID=1618980 RepID=A0A0G2AH72_9BACT|nr:MAG: hypothetical protein UY77_C0041G0008 [Candidatus Uhrbacteria bacterium GW2011_GWA2_53_10]